MKAILLGPHGQLGSDIRAANAKGEKPFEIVALGRGDLDLTDFEAVTQTLRARTFDCLINCSGYHKTDEVERNAQLAFTINAHLVRRLAEICAEKTARLVHISTDYVFGGQPTRVALRENDGKAPINVYGASKGMGEDLALLTGADVLLLRVASLFGVAGASGKGGNFVETMIRLGRDKGQVRVVDDQTMSPTATADVAEVLLPMLQEGLPAGIWHVVNSGAASWHEFACRIMARANIRAEVVPIGSAELALPAQRPAFSVLDNTKLARAMRPMRPWQDALDDYLAAKGHRAH